MTDGDWTIQELRRAVQRIESTYVSKELSDARYDVIRQEFKNIKEDLLDLKSVAIDTQREAKANKFQKYGIILTGITNVGVAILLYFLIGRT